MYTRCRVHGRVRYRVCGCILNRVHGRVRAVYTAVTRPCTRTVHVYTAVYTSVKAVYTAVYMTLLTRQFFFTFIFAVFLLNAKDI